MVSGKLAKHGTRFTASARFLKPRGLAVRKGAVSHGNFIWAKNGGDFGPVERRGQKVPVSDLGTPSHLEEAVHRRLSR